MRASSHCQEAVFDRRQNPSLERIRAGRRGCRMRTPLARPARSVLLLCLFGGVHWRFHQRDTVLHAVRFIIAAMVHSEPHELQCAFQSAAWGQITGRSMVELQTGQA